MALLLIIISITATATATLLNDCLEREDLSEHSCTFHLEKWQHFPSMLEVETVLLPVGQLPGVWERGASAEYMWGPRGRKCWGGWRRTGDRTVQPVGIQATYQMCALGK